MFSTNPIIGISALAKISNAPVVLVGLAFLIVRFKNETFSDFLTLRSRSLVLVVRLFKGKDTKPPWLQLWCFEIVISLDLLRFKERVETFGNLKYKNSVLA